MRHLSKAILVLSLAASLTVVSALPAAATSLGPARVDGQVGASTTSSVDWTQWGFNAQHTGYNPFETTLTRSNVGQLVSVFHTPIKTAPDPIVDNGVVYLSDSGSGEVQAIDADTGAKEWTRGACNTGEQTSDPAFAKGNVWVGLDDPGIASVTASGTEVRCVQDGDLFFTPLSAKGPTVYAGGVDGVLVAVDANTGKLRWSLALDPKVQPALQSPAVSADGSALFVGASDGYVYKVDAASGKLIWKHFVDTCAASAVSVSGPMLYVGGCNLYGLSAATGAAVWRSTRFGPYVETPAVADGLVIAGVPNTSGSDYVGVAAFDATTGKRVWYQSQYVPFAPTVANGVVYVNEEYNIVMFSTKTGREIGDLSASPTGGTFEGSALPVDGHLYVCSQTYEGVFSLWAYRP